MPDAYPGERPGLTGVDKVNEFIYRYMTRALIEGRDGEVISDPASSIAKKVGQLREGLLGIGVEEERITAVSSVAYIHHARRTAGQTAARPDAIDPEDLAIIMQEAPGV